MAYKIGQFNQVDTGLIGCNQAPASTYMSLVTTGQCKLKSADRDTNVSSGGFNVSSIFEEDCVEVPTMTQEPYYLHVKIKRLVNSAQTFKVWLCTYSTTGVEIKTQQIRTVTVAAGSEVDWVDFETVFTPLNGTFNCIVFELVRLQSDYAERPRRPLIVYQELSKINNVVNTINRDTKDGFVKIGVQTRPGFMMCINGEEIHVGRSGTYEIKNGIITVGNFSVINPAQEYLGNGLQWNGQSVEFETYLSYLATQYNRQLYQLQSISGNHNAVDHMSTCIFNTSKRRQIDSFILDYMYTDED